MQTCLTNVSRFWLTELRQGPMWPLSVRDFSKAWDFTKRLKGFAKKNRKIRSEWSEQRINEGKSVGVRLTNKEILGRRQNSRQTLRTRVKDIQTQTVQSRRTCKNGTNDFKWHKSAIQILRKWEFKHQAQKQVQAHKSSWGQATATATGTPAARKACAFLEIESNKKKQRKVAFEFHLKSSATPFHSKSIV